MDGVKKDFNEIMAKLDAAHEANEKLEKDMHDNAKNYFEKMEDYKKKQRVEINEIE